MIHIACAADENYAPHCAAMLHSLLCCNAPEYVTIYFLHGPSLSRQVIEGMSQLVTGLRGNIEFIEVEDAAVEGLQPKGRVAGVMWYRVFLPQRLPHLDRILYLDADTLVVDSLIPLWQTDLSGVYGAAVSNVLDREFRHRPAQLGIQHERDYFNSGVLLMNLATMREHGLSEKVCATARKHGKQLMWQDQDPLNIVFAEKWQKLHPRWNCQNSLFYSAHAVTIFGKSAVREACTSPAIVHFEGPALAKPWHYLSKHPYKAAYIQHRSMTPWGEFAQEENTIKNRLLKPFPTSMTVALLKLEHRMKNLLRNIVRRVGIQGAA